MCDDRERLIGYVYDDCENDERRVIEAHLAECPDCRREIADLRSVRQDLLAWDVPNHESVWRPFAPARPAFTWNQFPAWAMAAAAGIVLTMGAAGGVATHAWLSSGAPAQVAATNPAPGLTSADMQALERRVLATMRSEMDERVRLALSHEERVTTPVTGGDPEIAQLASQFAELNQRMGLMQTQVREIGRHQVASTEAANFEIAKLSRRYVTPVAQQGQTFGFGGR